VGQFYFTKDEEKINKGLESFTLPSTNLALNNVLKPLLKGFVHQTELMVTNLERLLNKQANNFDHCFIFRFRGRRKLLAKL